MRSGPSAEGTVDRVADLLRLRIGLRADDTLRGRLRRAIDDEALKRGQDAVTYAGTLTGSNLVMQDLLNRVTVQETSFFRHPRHFEVLVSDVLPSMPRPVTIWSAGCANGQEAFSLAMVLEEQGIDGHVIATDLSTAAVHRTVTARYSRRELSGLSAQRIAAYLRRSGDDWEMTRSIRDRVTVRQHNLLDSLPPEMRSCTVVFCRNVLIYLAPQPSREFLDRLADGLPADTILFLGGAETLWQISTRFKAFPIGDTFIHRLSTASRELASTASVDRRAIHPGTGRAAPTAPTRDQPAARVVPAAADAPASRAAPTADCDAAPETADVVNQLSAAAQRSVAAGDYDTAVVAFRKCTYLAPHEPLAQLHLGLALEAAGDAVSAHRAYATARRVLNEQIERTDGANGLEGYAAGEITRLLDSKLEQAGR